MVAHKRIEHMNALTTEVHSIPFSQLERMAQAIAKSGLFGAKTPEQALSLMLIAQAEGTHPATAARDYHVIQGRPSLKADTMLARFQQAGGRVEWHSYTDAKCEATFTHPQSGAVKIDWTMERAKSAGLTAKDNWKNYPRQMLRARTISEGVRTCYPGVAIGVYTPEEIADGVPEVDVTPAAQRVEAAIESASHTATGLTESEIADHRAAIDAAADAESLKAAFSSAWQHAAQAKDSAAAALFKTAYDAHKTGLAA
jgi:hypothetical protein